MKIGLFGLLIHSGNLGCQALTYSTLSILDKIEQSNQGSFEYIIFDDNAQEKEVIMLSQILNIDRNKFIVCNRTYKSFFCKVIGKIKFVNMLLTCDMIFDFTQGDSFSDIYGTKRFLSWTKKKELIENLKKPLILGPQTYGPFDNEKNREYAIKVINGADLLIARDELSCEYLSKYCKKKIFVTTDVAFELPFTLAKRSKKKKLSLGINISGLLWNTSFEKTERKIELGVDYSEFIRSIMKKLINDNKYNIFLIPHVEEDRHAIELIHSEFPQTVNVEMFKNPVEAKTFIAQMDCFVGSRMHATIAAFSAGVPTIPVSYSRKFEGLFYNLGYHHVVKLKMHSTESAVLEVLHYIDEKDFLEREMLSCQKRIDEKSNLNFELFRDVLMTSKKPRYRSK